MIVLDFSRFWHQKSLMMHLFLAAGIRSSWISAPRIAPAAFKAKAVWLVLDLDLSLGLGEMQGSEDAGYGNPGMLHTHGQSCTVQTQVWPAAMFKCVFRPASSPIIDLACL